MTPLTGRDFDTPHPSHPPGEPPGSVRGAGRAAGQDMPVNPNERTFLRR